MAVNIGSTVKQVIDAINSGSSGGSSLTMPIIRLGPVSDTNGTMNIIGSNALIFKVEVISGELQVGDRLQMCSRQLYCYNRGSLKKYKMRAYYGYTITADDVENRYITMTIDPIENGDVVRNMLRGGASYCSAHYPQYIRIRRPHPDNPKDNALFSNAVEFKAYGIYEDSYGNTYVSIR